MDRITGFSIVISSSDQGKGGADQPAGKKEPEADRPTPETPHPFQSHEVVAHHLPLDQGKNQNRQRNPQPADGEPADQIGGQGQPHHDQPDPGAGADAECGSSRHSCSSHDVDQGKQDQPDQVDHVPVGGPRFHPRMLPVAVAPSVGLHRHRRQDHHAHDDVHEVEEGQRQIEHVELVRAQPDPRLDVVDILMPLHHQEEQPHGQGRQQPLHTAAAVILANRRHRPDHEIAAGDQGKGVDQRRIAVEAGLVVVEHFHVPHTGKGVGPEKRAECGQFSQDEDPDRQIPRRKPVGLDCRLGLQGARCSNGITHSCHAKTGPVLHLDEYQAEWVVVLNRFSPNRKPVI